MIISKYNLTNGRLNTGNVTIIDNGIMMVNGGEHKVSGKIFISIKSGSSDSFDEVYILKSGSLKTNSLINEGIFFYNGGILRVKDSSDAANPTLVNKGTFVINKDLDDVGTALINEGSLLMGNNATMKTFLQSRDATITLTNDRAVLGGGSKFDGFNTVDGKGDFSLGGGENVQHTVTKGSSLDILDGWFRVNSNLNLEENAKILVDNFIFQDGKITGPGSLKVNFALFPLHLFKRLLFNAKLDSKEISFPLL